MSKDIDELPPDELNVELSRLQAKKLELEILDLRVRWWQRPAWIAPLATIVAAITGLMWASATGFFDTQRRDLENRRRDLLAETRLLAEARDKQSQVFHNEQLKYENLTKQLQQRIATLQAKVSALDVPIIEYLQVWSSPWGGGNSRTATSSTNHWN